MHRVKFTKELPLDFRTIMCRRRYKPINPESDQARHFIQPLPDQEPPHVPASHVEPSVCPARPAADPSASSERMQNFSAQQIPKPAGSAGRPNGGGYSLDAKLRQLGWRADEIESLQKLVKHLCGMHLDITAPYSEQDTDLRQIVINKVKQNFPILEAYVNAWPVTEVMKAVMKSARDKSKREKLQKAAEGNLPPPSPTSAVPLTVNRTSQRRRRRPSITPVSP
ncbi:hypothetical protein SISNIDRAFT_469324 [Sistotremastrum niveocremeum HHB9708]|uniref:Uncharacterized protein n=1 Tax=Sistotremastrum niveocremeum HHB9708 TaxID=1314777 RepID=A0A164QDS0_9AGAM|nr:hypothetical protein SISNIDRAFT_469324 [Sistotremastrum niveocremeum HHB9708]